jgi:spore coat polysaccharide biosynthesis protein SpsF
MIEAMPIWAVVAARMTSSRMPGKSLVPLAGTPSLAHLIRRLRRSRYLDGIVIATTDRRTDDPIRSCARTEGVAVFSGSEDDVLDRTVRAAESVGASIIVQVTGDCPLIDAAVVDRTIEAYLVERPDYACNRMPESYPNGMDTEVFATSLLAEVSKITEDPADREHVSLYIYEHPERYRLLNVTAPNEHHWPELRLTLDTEEDYRLISAIFDALLPRDPAFGLSDTLKWLRENPKMLELNRTVDQKPVR